MENQHRKITGYRDLTQDEIDLMNEIKEHSVLLGLLVSRLRQSSSPDQRWVEIGAIDIQKGMMAITRAVAKPSTF